jgi:GAF domain-containing protein
MKRRSRAGGGPPKARRRKATPKRRHGAKAVQHGGSVTADQETEVARLTRELNEAWRQRTATAEVLRLLSGSHSDLNRLFDTILANATNLCQANFGTLSFYEDEAFHIVAMHNVPPAFAEFRRREPLVRTRPMLRMAETKQFLYMADVTEYVASHPADRDAAAFAKLTQVRTVIGVPMLKDGDVIGAIVIYRKQVRGFDDKEIELLKDFAAQAVIAIENARLLNELRQRTTDLTEALEQQTATSEVLRVISSSPNNLDPVFRTMLTNATRLCGADFGQLLLYLADGHFRNVAMYNAPPAFAELREHEPTVRASGVLTRALHSEQSFLHIADCIEDPTYRQGDADFVKFVDLCGVRTLLGVPLLKDKEPIGVIGIYRREVRPFADKQVALLIGFAAQAVIAIENTRLLNELRKRTDELETSLEYQTATSDVLKVISRSVFDLQKILEFVAETAARLCAAKQVGIFLLENHVYRFTIGFGLTSAYREIEEGLALEPGPETLVGRVALEGETVHILDALSDPHYGPKDDIRAAKVRSILGVPLTREGRVVGVIALARETVSSFSSEQIELVRTFADQAVIAIENADCSRNCAREPTSCKCSRRNSSNSTNNSNSASSTK